MATRSCRSTVYFDPELHKALRLKAAQENRSLSEIVNEAVSLLALEDAEDITDADARTAEPALSYTDMVRTLKADGVI